VPLGAETRGLGAAGRGDERGLGAVGRGDEREAAAPLGAETRINMKRYNFG
jgi:hypothetical protein